MAFTVYTDCCGDSGMPPAPLIPKTVAATGSMAIYSGCDCVTTFVQVLPITQDFLTGMASGGTYYNANETAAIDQLVSDILQSTGAAQVLFFPGFSAFPTPGINDCIYVATDTKKGYFWTGSGFDYLFSQEDFTTAYRSKLDIAEVTTNKGVPNGYASLDGTGKLTAAQVPDLAISQYLGAVSSQAAMLALVGQQGDWCTRSDLGTNWIITAQPSSVLSNWIQLSYPAAPVTSVNNKTGAVVLSATDVGAIANQATSAQVGQFWITGLGQSGYFISTITGNSNAFTSNSNIPLWSDISADGPIRNIGRIIGVRFKGSYGWEPTTDDFVFYGGDGSSSTAQELL